MNLGAMMKQAQQMQAKMEEVQRKLDDIAVEGASGGGMVKVVSSAKGDVKSVTIDPSIVDPADVEMIEDLVLAALNDAKSKAEAAMAEEMKSVTGGLQLPPGMKLPL